MQIKQKQAQFTPDQNCTNTICYPNDEEILHTTKILTTAWINWENAPSQLNEHKIPETNEEWIFRHDQKTLTVCTSPKF